MEIKEFKNFIKTHRTRKIPTPFNLTFLNFYELKFTQKNKEFFFNNASYIVEMLRKKNWEKYLEEERKFSSYIYEQLIDQNVINRLTKVEAIKWFINSFTDHIYTLSLSNTQSRRARAGLEFEAIIELILMGAQIPFDTQGSVGAGIFESNHLAKLVDCVSPGATEYKLDKRNTSLISAKTTLRERWQEVGDEMARTMAREMYLATLDTDITSNTIQLISGNNIILVTTKRNKENLYKNSPYVISFEDMLKELNTKAQVWKSYIYSKHHLEEKQKRYKQQIEKHENNPFIVNYFKHQLNLLDQSN